MFDLSGLTALVTGAGQGVGAGISRALADHGATVAVNDLRAARANETVEAIHDAGGDAVAAPFDVTHSPSVIDGVNAIGRIDILVCNAGNGGEQAMSVRPFTTLEPTEWEAAIRVNLYGVMNCCHAVAPGMCERGWGRIITISSAAGTAGTRIGVSPYSAGKGGGIAFTRTLALEVARQGVTANTLALGLMDVPDPEITEQLSRTIPVGRTGTPQDVAAACVWLTSKEASWVTGQTIEINGGAVTT